LSTEWFYKFTLDTRYAVPRPYGIVPVIRHGTQPNGTVPARQKAAECRPYGSKGQWLVWERGRPSPANHTVLWGDGCG